MKSSTLYRPNLRSIAFLVTAIGLSGLTGCVAAPRRTRTVIIEQPAPPPVAVVQPATPAPEVDYVVEVAPPPPRREVITVRPSRRHVWLAGHWVYRGREYVWVPGYWALPPRAHVVYVQPHWERRGHGWILIEGHWR